MAAILEGIRDGRSVSDRMTYGATLLKVRDVMPGVAAIKILSRNATGLTVALEAVWKMVREDLWQLPPVALRRYERGAPNPLTEKKADCYKSPTDLGDKGVSVVSRNW